MLKNGYISFACSKSALRLDHTNLCSGSTLGQPRPLVRDEIIGTASAENIPNQMMCFFARTRQSHLSGFDFPVPVGPVQLACELCRGQDKRTMCGKVSHIGNPE
jgi:hypothetical protein